MKPNFDLKQFIAVATRLMRHPWLFLRCHHLLIKRGLCWFADNPDLVWAKELLPLPDQDGPTPLILIVDQERIIFSFMLAKGRTGNLPAATIRRWSDLNSFREECEYLLDLPLQAILIEATIFDCIYSHVPSESCLDPFFVTVREILSALSSRLINFSPLPAEIEMLSSLESEELLGKFGARFGLAPRNPIRLWTILRGLGLALRSPFVRWSED
jgi:hypothetical protein